MVVHAGRRKLRILYVVYQVRGLIAGLYKLRGVLCYFDQQRNGDFPQNVEVGAKPPKMPAATNRQQDSLNT